VVALALAVCILFVFLCRRIMLLPAGERRMGYAVWLAPILFLALSFAISRGFGKRPIGPSTPLLYFRPTAQPLVNNSTLNVLYSIIRAKSRLERKDFYTAPGLDSIFTIRRQYNADSSLQKKNVVIFVLESFSEAYFRPGPLRAQTPFLDSLRGKSRVFTSAFQNGHESTKGLLSILASMPPFLDEPLFISNYNAVPFDGIGSLLKNEGYTTNFFLGAEYDHFNFAKLCRMVGIDHYYSKDNYHHPGNNDDGNWGIYDEFFFPHFADVTSQMPQPFFSVLYNISSHPPFKLPPARRAAFSIAGQDAQRNSISYVDDCFRRLFDTIRKQPWFANSIFVFTADHSLLDNTGRASYLYESLHIPLFIYDPADPLYREMNSPVQQLDIVPTIADMLHYPKPFMSFGNSMLRPTGGYSISRSYGEYQLIDSVGITGFDENSGKLVFYYDWRNDTLLKNNLYTDPVGKERERSGLVKGILQRFNNSILDRTLLINRR
jgi:phosphoglycerol transferase MdoB-like AlkP superfamily enzyme